MSIKNIRILLIIGLTMIWVVLLLWQGPWVEISNITSISTESGIGVYWDSAATDMCRYIDWGQLSPGSEKTTALFVKNESNQSIFYLLTTRGWHPLNASDFMVTRWDYDDSPSSVNAIRSIHLTLSISPRIKGIVDFSFDVVILGNSFMWADINHDWKVDILDLASVAIAYGRILDDSAWNVDVDINRDDIVDMKDVAIVSHAYGVKYV